MNQTSQQNVFVGFGFGAIQAGLFLYEAFKGGFFNRLVVAEVVPEIVEAVRNQGGRFWVNIAFAGKIESVEVGPVEIFNPGVDEDRARLVEAVAQAQEISTAVPSVAFYNRGGEAAIHRILAEGLKKKLNENHTPAILYAAENHNHAAEILQELVAPEIRAEMRQAFFSRIWFLNTVIGKMSGVVTSQAQIKEQALSAITPADPRAFLVESFNKILISKIAFGPHIHFQRGIKSFVEKDDLLPFEEAKLYGHNATHALAAYLALSCGLKYIAEIKNHPDLLSFVRAAFLKESGETLIRKHRGVDPLFTPEGYALYADDLLERMTNPYLRDSVERVGRDPERKLGWGDRLIGTMREALKQNVLPRRYALGAAAALVLLEPRAADPGWPVEPVLLRLWNVDNGSSSEQEKILAIIEDARRLLGRWRQQNYCDLEKLAGISAK
jgi:mannitol-1-phosphate 5-dehydrogenase